MTFNPFDLSGKMALVSGASAGLGAHFSEVLADANVHVVLAARRIDQLEVQAAKIRDKGGKCSTVVLDVSNAESIAALAPFLAKTDILVNNAGVVREVMALDHSEADWDAVIDINLKGMFLLAQAAAKAMRDGGRQGSIINIASVLGLRQVAGLVSYAVSKAGAIQLTKTMALELARYGIRVNALAPGYLDTDLNGSFWESENGKAMIKRIPQRRLGRLKDLDGPLLLLASEASAYMTGSVITVDGGHVVSSL